MDPDAIQCLINRLWEIWESVEEHLPDSSKKYDFKSRTCEECDSWATNCIPFPNPNVFSEYDGCFRHQRVCKKDARACRDFLALEEECKL